VGALSITSASRGAAGKRISESHRKSAALAVSNLAAHQVSSVHSAAHGLTARPRAPGSGTAEGGAGRYSKRPPCTTEKMTRLAGHPLRRKRKPWSRHASPFKVRTARATSLSTVLRASLIACASSRARSSSKEDVPAGKGRARDQEPLELTAGHRAVASPITVRIPSASPLSPRPGQPCGLLQRRPNMDPLRGGIVIHPAA
jgi:hypothetical protein